MRKNLQSVLRRVRMGGVLLTCLVASGAVACARAAPAGKAQLETWQAWLDSLPDPAAKVDGEPIGKDEVATALGHLAADNPPRDAQARVNLLARVLEARIDAAVVRHALTDAERVDADQTADADAVAAASAFATDAAFAADLAAKGETRESLRAAYWLQRALGGRVAAHGVPPVTEAEIAARYAARRDRFVDQARVRLWEIGAACPAGADAVAQAAALSRLREAQEALDKGELFPDVARRLSQSPSANQGGDTGLKTRAELDPGLAAVAFVLTRGQFASAPVRSAFGWHLVRLVDARPERPLSLAEATPAIAWRLRRIRALAALRQLLADWRNAAHIERFVDMGSSPALLMAALPSGTEDDDLAR